MKRLTILGIIACVGFLFIQGTALAAPGDLDNTFGTAGVVSYYEPGAGCYASTVTIQTDGKIVLVGRQQPDATDHNVLVLRYADDGTLDTSFGTNGVVKYDPGDEIFVDGYDARIQSDGKIVVVGSTDEFTRYDVIVLRYNPNGTLDTSFDTDGVVTYDTGGDALAFGYAVALQQDGKIIATGEVYGSSSVPVGLPLLRYTVNGTLDTTFGTGGVVMYNNSSGDSEAGTALAIQPDGKIIVAGSMVVETTPGIGERRGLLLRFTSSGGLDTTFGTNGVVVYNSGGSHRFDDLRLQPDGKIVVVGNSYVDFDNDIILLRYNANGTLDTSFGTNGIARYEDGYAYGNALANQEDGKIVITGYDYNVVTDTMILRYETDGSLDDSFGIGGVVEYDMGGNDVGYDVAVQSDDKIIIMGEHTISGLRNDIFMMRLFGLDADAIESVVETLPASHFRAKVEASKNAILSILSNIQRAIEDSRIAAAIKALENLRLRVDGCDGSLTELPDTNDWVVDCGSQRSLRDLIDQLINELSTSL
jgi:uncharacterized delta-60 repeat protein